MNSQFSFDELSDYSRDGFVIVRELFQPAEVAKLLRFAQADPSFAQSVSGRKDATGKETKLAVWNYSGDNLYSLFVGSERIVCRMEQTLGGEVYLYHMKMMLKEPQVGGAWEWHQDYGYWYNNGCLYPLMASCLIAVSRADRANGCLQVLRGSHKLGRMDHGKTGDQTGADLERVAAAMQRLELVYCECEPGDAIFFDCNLLHRSDSNQADYPRWSLIGCYNARSNDPYKTSKHPGYSPLQVVGPEAIEAFQA